ncbi:lipopolysaccharide biosynthesis protein [Candidatus Omnitrophota bacterium]
MLIQKLFKKETIGQSAGIVLFFTVLQRIIQTGRGVVFARLLGPAEYGVYTLAFFFIPLAVTVARLGIPSCFSRYIPQYEQKGALRDFLRKTYLLVVAGGAFIALICFLNAKTLSQIIYGSFQYQRIIAICALTIFPYAIFEAVIYSFSGMRIFKLSSVLGFSKFLIFSALGIVLVIFYPKAESTILANLIAFILVVIFFSFIFRKYLIGLDSQNSKIKEANFYSKIFKFSIFFIISPIINTIFNYTDRWMLSRLVDLSKVGIYSVALNISGIIFLFGMVAGSVLLPNISNIWEQGDKYRVMHMLNFSLKMNTLFLLFGALILSLFKRQIVSILYGADYMQCLPIIGMLLIFWLYHGIYWTVAGYAELIEKTYIPLICGFVGLMSNIFLNYILIPPYGLMGAAVATTFSFGLTLIMMYAWFLKEGLIIKPKVIFVCILPLIFIFSNQVTIIFFIALLGIILGTNLIVTKEEKSTLIKKLKEEISRLKKGKK